MKDYICYSNYSGNLNSFEFCTRDYCTYSKANYEDKDVKVLATLNFTKHKKNNII